MKVDGITSNVQNYYEPIKSVKDIAVENNKADSKEKVAAVNEDEKKIEQQNADSKKVTSEVYGDVISKSADGDVTRAAKQSLSALSDGLVMQKDNTPEVTTSLKGANEAISEAAAKAAKPESETSKDIYSLTSYTSDQLDVLYAEGKISRFEYDKEVGRREELKKQTTPTVEEEKRAEETDKKDESEAERIQQEIEGNNEFAKGMAKLNETAIVDNQKIEALNTAKENDRVDLMNQIFGQN